jgi:hypothetical protein
MDKGSVVGAAIGLMRPICWDGVGGNQLCDNMNMKSFSIGHKSKVNIFKLLMYLFLMEIIYFILACVFFST